jgi:hypothetical protein
MKNKKWYSVPSTESWQYMGLMFGALWLAGLSLFDIGVNLIAHGENLLKYLDWILIITTTIVGSWYAGVHHIQEEWNTMWFDRRDDIENIRDDKMYMTSFWKYLFCKVTLIISWLILIGYGIYVILGIQETIDEHPSRIIIGLLVVIVIIIYEKKK